MAKKESDKKQDAKLEKDLTPKQRDLFEKKDAKMDKKKPSRSADKKMDKALKKEVKKEAPAKKKK
jgi:hypothetical protein